MPVRTRIVEHSLPDSVLPVAERAAHPRCAGFVHSCYGYEERSLAPLARSELANASVVMSLELGPPLRVEARSSLSDFSERARRRAHAGRSGALET